MSFHSLPKQFRLAKCIPKSSQLLIKHEPLTTTILFSMSISFIWSQKIRKGRATPTDTTWILQEMKTLQRHSAMKPAVRQQHRQIHPTYAIRTANNNIQEKIRFQNSTSKCETVDFHLPFWKRQIKSNSVILLSFTRLKPILPLWGNATQMPKKCNRQIKLQHCVGDYMRL